MRRARAVLSAACVFCGAVTQLTTQADAVRLNTIPFLDDPDATPMAGVPGPPGAIAESAKPPLVKVESVPPLEPENPDAIGEVITGVFYEALDKDDRWHVVMPTKILGDHRFDARVAPFGAHQYGIQKLVREKQWQQDNGDQQESATAEDSYFASTGYRSIFEDRWPVVYERFVRKIPIVNDPYPPQGFR
ncbi:unnamed protein product [Amoebophrya sp. A120]|nr:unnamed protein product [Amoebophrya sp. A120]|eukprot:GSA120T00007902001.1